MSHVTLYADRGCPFAHRVLALLHELGVEHTVHTSRIGKKPAGVGAYSASERIPLLVHGELVLTESRVMLEYLVERYDYRLGLPDDVDRRARERLAMALVDEHVAAGIFDPGRERDPVRFEEALTLLDSVVRRPARPTLLALQFAPFWVQMQWVEWAGSMVRAIRSRPTLSGWLDECVALDCVVATSPDPDQLARDVDRARREGLLAPLGADAPDAA